MRPAEADEIELDQEPTGWTHLADGTDDPPPPGRSGSPILTREELRITLTFEFRREGVTGRKLACPGPGHGSTEFRSRGRMSVSSLGPNRGLLVTVCRFSITWS